MTQASKEMDTNEIEERVCKLFLDGYSEEDIANYLLHISLCDVERILKNKGYYD